MLTCPAGEEISEEEGNYPLTPSSTVQVYSGKMGD
jgi:hypothetical protein